MRAKRYMDITGNIREVGETSEMHKEKLGKLEKALENEERFIEQQLANLHQDDEEIELKQTECPRDSANLFECSLMVTKQLSDPTLDKHIVECAICGRFDWKKKDSLL
jgi:predicted  nucleic acid-binding Zn-ribbon protein